MPHQMYSSGLKTELAIRTAVTTNVAMRILAETLRLNSRLIASNIMMTPQ